MARHMRLWSGWGAALALAIGLPWGLAAVGTLPQQPPQTPAEQRIPSLSEPGEGLTIRDRSRRSGHVRFAAAEGRGILVSVQANAPTETRARSFVGLYGHAFGIGDQSDVRLARQPDRDDLGIEHARFEQQHQGVPVTGSALFVHLRGARVSAVNAHTLPADRLPAETTPAIDAAAATAAARAFVMRRGGQAIDVVYSAPRLEIFNRGLLEDGEFPSHLTWFVEARGRSMRELLWVDARSGGIVFRIDQRTDARVRQVYDANAGSTLPGTLRRSEGQGATGDFEENRLYDLLGAAYDFFYSSYNRDSYNGQGATMVASVDFLDGSCPNAFWNGQQTAFCDGVASEDVVPHEFTHAVIEHTANLFYFNQSGSLNESYADIFGEMIDQVDWIGSDAPELRWQIGEGSTLGVIRHMMTPTLFGDPGKMSDPQFSCSPYLDGDFGGVHINSGIPNHAFALMVDGGTYNGHTIAPIGLAKAGKVHYRALTTYLSSGSTFLDNFNALTQACSDLIGSGLTASDCTQVTEALRAVEMNVKPSCATAVASPPLCANGATPSTVSYTQNFDVYPPPNWTVSSTSSAQWGIGDFWGKGELHAWGPDAAETSIHTITSPPITVPANGRMHFEHAFFFDEDAGTYYDGGVLEYSTNAGASWNSAQILFEGGRTYNGTLTAANPLGAVQAFVYDSFGFTGTRLNLSSLAGQSVTFRFRVATDEAVGYYGWAVDNVRVYSCPGGTSSDLVRNGAFSSGGTFPSTPPPNWLVWSTGTAMVWNTSGGTFNFQRPAGNTQAVVFQNTAIPVPAFTSLQTTLTMANSDPGRKRFSVVVHDADFSDLGVCTFWLDGAAPARSYTVRTHTNKAWAGATVSIYAATVGNGGFYQLDNVALTVQPAQSTERTDCVDPVAPGAGGTTSGELVQNGTFTNTLGPWGTFGNIASQLAGGVFEFFKLTGSPSGVLLQQNLGAMTNDQKLSATFQLGNSSGVRQRVTVLLHDNDFSDLHACTFVLPPGLPLSAFAMRTYATKAWTNTTVSVYPATTGTAPVHQWLRIDNVSLSRTNAAVAGTECVEPGG